MIYPRLQIFEAPEGHTGGYPFRHGMLYLVLGEIDNMPGHLIVIDDKGRVRWGYHDEHFREPLNHEM